MGTTAVTQRKLDHCAGSDHSILGHNDDSVPNVVPVSVAMLFAVLVHQSGALAHSCVLIDNDAIQHNICAYSQRLFSLGCVRCGISFIKIRAEQHRARDLRARADLSADTND